MKHTKPAAIKNWAVYKHPSDYPNSYVARLFLNDQPTQTCVISEEYSIIEHVLLEMGLYRLPRMAEDEPHILEAWV